MNVSGTISNFMQRHYNHFNARELLDASKSLKTHFESNGKLFLAMAGAMSTAELGKSIAEMIRADKIHAICTTGANLEEDIFNLVAHNSYKNISNYRDLNLADEKSLFDSGLNRVTDTAIPEQEAMRKIEKHLLPIWQEHDKKNEPAFPHEYIYELLTSKVLQDEYQIDPKDSWVLAACEKNIPIFVPGWADSSLGNYFVAENIRKNIKNPSIVKEGIDYMKFLVQWYTENSFNSKIGFFQIGGGISGDFPICVVPLINQDIMDVQVPLWSYFCQISDSTTSYGSYSGAPPNEKITWGKLSITTPRFMIESDATIVVPLMFAYVLGQ